MQALPFDKSIILVFLQVKKNQTLYMYIYEEPSILIVK